MKKLALAAACLAVLGISSVASAGLKSGYVVSINTWNGVTFAAGAIGSARNTQDNSQYIGCELIAYKDYSYVQCWAYDTSGRYATCYNRVNQGMKDAVASITDGSFLQFQTDPADATKCGLIGVTTASYNAPPQP